MLLGLFFFKEVLKLFLTIALSLKNGKHILVHEEDLYTIDLQKEESRLFNNMF